MLSPKTRCRLEAEDAVRVMCRRAQARALASMTLMCSTPCLHLEDTRMDQGALESDSSSISGNPNTKPKLLEHALRNANKRMRMHVFTVSLGGSSPGTSESCSLSRSAMPLNELRTPIRRNYAHTKTTSVEGVNPAGPRKIYLSTAKRKQTPQLSKLLLHRFPKRLPTIVRTSNKHVASIQETKELGPQLK